jgi:type VI protein secretion system component VasF
MKYIGLAFQMFTIIGLGTWAGLEVQKRSQMHFPLWVLLFCFVSIFISFYQLYSSLKQDERNEEKNKKR